MIVDLDGTLWPGVLAETGSPFAWTPEISGAFSFIGLYFGLHEALKSLKKRGVVLACVSKNDEATVRELWKYPDHYPKHRLLTPDDFVTWRVNWDDKVGNIRSIAEELGFALDAFLFIDDNAVSATVFASGCRRSRSGAKTSSPCAGACSTTLACSRFVTGKPRSAAVWSRATGPRSAARGDGRTRRFVFRAVRRFRWSG